MYLARRWNITLAGIAFLRYLTSPLMIRRLGIYTFLIGTSCGSKRESSQQWKVI